MADERRRQTRTPVNVPARYVTSEGLVRCRLANLSLGGALIQTAEPLAFGTKIELTIELPDEQGTVAVQATVRWNHNDSMGVQFGVMGAQETYRITEFVAAQTKPGG